MASLSGPNSRRRLGTQSGALRREARTLARNGNERAAGALQLSAAEQKLQEGGAITSSEETIRERSLMQARDRGLMRQQRDSVLKPEAGAAAPTLGTTPRTSLSRPSASYDSDNNGIPNSLQRPAATLQGPPAPRRLSGGLIDGKPAASVLSEMRQKQEFVGPPSSASPVEGPLTRAMNEALARNAGRAADATAAGALTAGLNAAPTPKLDTSFPVASTTPVAAAVPAVPPVPTPTLRRPATGPSFTTEGAAARSRFLTGEDRVTKSRADAEEALRKKKAGIPDIAPGLGSDSGLNRAYRSLAARYTK